MCPNSKSVSSRIKVCTGDHILIPNIHQSHNFRVSGIPEINWITQANSEQIGHGPVNKVEVIIIIESWGIKNFCRDLVNSSLFFGFLDFDVLWNLNEWAWKESV